MRLDVAVLAMIFIRMITVFGSCRVHSLLVSQPSGQTALLRKANNKIKVSVFDPDSRPESCKLPVNTVS